MNRDGIADPRPPGAAPPPLGPGEVHVWRAELPGDGGRETARATLRRILAAYLDVEPAAEEIRLAAGRGGKPRLARSPGRLSFNLSHADRLALVAVAAGRLEVGVDLERLRPRRDLVGLSARWLPEPDAAAVAAASEEEREAVFYAAWTRHEARVKCTGAGLSGAPPGPEVLALRLDIDPGYAAALATVGTAPPAVRRLEFAALDAAHGAEPA